MIERVHLPGIVTERVHFQRNVQWIISLYLHFLELKMQGRFELEAMVVDVYVCMKSQVLDEPTNDLQMVAYQYFIPGETSRSKAVATAFYFTSLRRETRIRVSNDAT